MIECSRRELRDRYSLTDDRRVCIARTLYRAVGKRRGPTRFAELAMSNPPRIDQDSTKKAGSASDVELIHLPTHEAADVIVDWDGEDDPGNPKK